MDSTNESIVQYKFNGEELQAFGNSKLFIDGGEQKHRQYIHSVSKF